MATGGGFVRSIERSCDEYYDYCCSPCSAQGRNEEAIKFCVECREYVCQKCLQDHDKFAIMKTHQILDKISLEVRGPQQSPSLPTERCSQHHGNVIDTYCDLHADVCCGTCVSLCHRSCKMEYLPTAAKGIKMSQEYKNIVSSMQNIQQQLGKLNIARQDQLKTLEQEKSDVLCQIKDFRTSVSKRLDELEKIATDELKAKHRAIQDEINADIKRLDEMLRSMETNMKKLETSPGENESQLFVYVKTAKKIENEGSKLQQLMERDCKRSSLKFSINPNIEDYLKSQNSLGDFCDEDTRQRSLGDCHDDDTNQKSPGDFNNDDKSQKSQSDFHDDEKKQKSLDDFQEDEHIYSAALHGMYNVRVKNDTIFWLQKKSDINGSCQLEDGTILVVDNNTAKLKRLDRSYQVRGYCDLPSGPFAVCAIGPQEVAVTLYTAKKVQLVSVGNIMTLTRSFGVECETCRGVAYTNDQLFVSCYPAAVRVYNTLGALMKTIHQDSTGQNMFSDPCHIALSTDRTQMHIADYYNGVITLGIHGDKQSQFTDPELTNAYGVCVGNNNEMFVCGYNSNNIFQIGRNGRKLGVLLGEYDGITGPRSLCWDRHNSRLIVTMWNTGNIKVFDMK